MLTFQTDSRTALVVLHEIYGINPHIRQVCAQWHASGYAVYCPDLYQFPLQSCAFRGEPLTAGKARLLPAKPAVSAACLRQAPHSNSCSFDLELQLPGLPAPFAYAQQEEAYATYKQRVGFGSNSQLHALLHSLRLAYRNIILMGFSAGATLAWTHAAQPGLCDGMIGYYGSRIRDYLDLRPACPALLVFAGQEPGFPAEQAAKAFEAMPRVTACVLEGSHGFCDPFSEHYHALSAARAMQLSQSFLDNTCSASAE